MIIDTEKLQTIRTWAENYKREDSRVVGCRPEYAHELLNPENYKPIAKRVQEEYRLVMIDGVKFVARISDLPKPKTKKGGRK